MKGCNGTVCQCVAGARMCRFIKETSAHARAYVQVHMHFCVYASACAYAFLCACVCHSMCLQNIMSRIDELYPQNQYVSSMTAMHSGLEVVMVRPATSMHSNRVGVQSRQDNVQHKEAPSPGSFESMDVTVLACILRTEFGSVSHLIVDEDDISCMAARIFSIAESRSSFCAK